MDTALITMCDVCFFKGMETYACSKEGLIAYRHLDTEKVMGSFIVWDKIFITRACACDRHRQIFVLMDRLPVVYF